MSAEPVQALVLRTFDFGETSQIAHFFTRELGRLHGMAKGARRLKGSFQGGLDVLVLGEAAVYGRRAGADLRTLASFRTIDHFPGLRERLPRYHNATHAAALLLAFAREEQPMEAVFDLTVAALRMLEVADDTQAAALGIGYEALLLGASGFGPELTACVTCGRPARNVQTTRLSAFRGGLLCSNCRGDDPRAARLTGAGVHALRALTDGSLATAAELPADPRLRAELRDALTHWTSYLLDRRLPTVRLL